MILCSGLPIPRANAGRHGIRAELNLTIESALRVPEIAGVQPVAGRFSVSDEPKFICDDHCGRLARWLRVVGFDCLHDQRCDNARLLKTALRDDRVILTRDRSLGAQALARRILCLEEADPLAQLRAVVRRMGLELRSERFFRRCSVCNAPTASVGLAEVADRLPPYVRRTQMTFRHCRSCDHIYWPGTHVRRMQERLARAGLLPKE